MAKGGGIVNDYSVPMAPGRWPPWSRIQGLNEMTAEAGVDFDQFIESITTRRSISDMAVRFQVSPATIESLQDHFYRYGIGSVKEAIKLFFLRILTLTLKNNVQLVTITKISRRRPSIQWIEYLKKVSPLTMCC
jgi:hypothetical protein